MADYGGVSFPDLPKKQEKQQSASGSGNWWENTDWGQGQQQQAPPPTQGGWMDAGASAPVSAPAPVSGSGNWWENAWAQGQQQQAPQTPPPPSNWQQAQQPAPYAAGGWQDAGASRQQETPPPPQWQPPAWTQQPSAQQQPASAQPKVIAGPPSPKGFALADWAAPTPQPQATGGYVSPKASATPLSTPNLFTSPSTPQAVAPDAKPIRFGGIEYPSNTVHLRLPLVNPPQPSQLFGQRPAFYAPYGLAGHEGIDWMVPVGTPVYAATDGVVSYTNGGPYGTRVIVTEPVSGVKTSYAHLSARDVPAGTVVKAGQEIGKSGNTGNSEAPHLHFMVQQPGIENAPEKGMLNPVFWPAGTAPVQTAGALPGVGAGGAPVAAATGLLTTAKIAAPLLPLVQAALQPYTDPATGAPMAAPLSLQGIKTSAINAIAPVVSGAEQWIAGHPIVAGAVGAAGQAMNALVGLGRVALPVPASIEMGGAVEGSKRAALMDQYTALNQQIQQTRMDAATKYNLSGEQVGFMQDPPEIKGMVQQLGGITDQINRLSVQTLTPLHMSQQLAGEVERPNPNYEPMKYPETLHIGGLWTPIPWAPEQVKRFEEYRPGLSMAWQMTAGADQLFALGGGVVKGFVTADRYIKFTAPSVKTGMQVAQEMEDAAKFATSKVGKLIPYGTLTADSQRTLATNGAVDWSTMMAGHFNEQELPDMWKRWIVNPDDPIVAARTQGVSTSQMAKEAWAIQAKALTPEGTVGIAPKVDAIDELIHGVGKATTPEQLAAKNADAVAKNAAIATEKKLTSNIGLQQMMMDGGLVKPNASGKLVATDVLKVVNDKLGLADADAITKLAALDNAQRRALVPLLGGALPTVERAPLTEGGMLQAIANLAGKYDKAGEYFYPRTPASGAMKVRQKINGALAWGYMGINPGYAIRNTVNNATTALVDGMFPFQTARSMTRWWEDFGFMPIAAKSGIGSAGDAWKTSESALAFVRGLREVTPFTPGNAFGGVTLKTGMLQVGQNTERMFSERIVTSAAQKWWGQLWHSTVRDFERAHLTPLGLPTDLHEALVRELYGANNHMQVRNAVRRLIGGDLTLDSTISHTALDAIEEAAGPEAAATIREVIAAAPQAARPAVLDAMTTVAEVGEARGARAAAVHVLADMTVDTEDDIVKFLNEIDKLIGDSKATHDAMFDKVRDAAAAMADRRQAEPLWRAAWQTHLDDMRDLYTKIQGLQTERMPEMGFTPEAVKHFQDGLNKTYETWAQYSDRLRATWAKHWTLAPGSPERAQLWADQKAFAAQHWQTWQRERNAGVVAERADIRVALARHEKMRPSGGAPVEPGAPVPQPSKLSQMIASGEVDANQLTDAERAQLGKELAGRGPAGKAEGTKPTAPKLPPAEPPAAAPAPEPVGPKPKPAPAAPSPTKPVAPAAVEDLTKLSNEELYAFRHAELAKPNMGRFDEADAEIKTRLNAAYEATTPAPAAPTAITNDDLRNLAHQAQIATVTEKGKPFDQWLYNTINSDLGLEPGTIKNFSQLTPQQRTDVAAALQARAERIEPVKPTWEAGALAKPGSEAVAPVAPELVAPAAEAQQTIQTLANEAAAQTSARLAVKDIVVAPDRFQFKLDTASKTGTTKQFEKVKEWNPALGKGVSVWVDPADGKTYVVNGHHRLEIAQRLGATDIEAPYYIQVKTAPEARMIGALQNIAEGRGTPIDAAKVFRDAGMSQAVLDQYGLAMSESNVRQGMALANLHDALFNATYRHELPLERAVIIGERVPNKDLQLQLVREIDKQAAKGRKITNEVVAELADAITNGPKETVEQVNLFGTEQLAQSNAFEKADFYAYVRGRLGQDKRLFDFAAKNAETLGRVGTIDRAASQGISQEAAQLLDLFDTVKNQTGPISDIGNEAAAQLAKGGSANATKEQYYERLVKSLPDAISGRQIGAASGDVAGVGASGIARAGEAQTGLLGAEQPGPNLFGEPTGGAANTGSWPADLDYTGKRKPPSSLGIVYSPMQQAEQFHASAATALKRILAALRDERGSLALPGATPAAVASRLTLEQARALQKVIEDQLLPNMFRDKARVYKVATDARNFALIDYSRRGNLNDWVQWLFPYGKWYYGTYKNWAQRILANPSILANYARFEQMLHEHNTQYYRQLVGDPNAVPDPYFAQAIHMPFNGMDYGLDVMKSLNPLNAVSDADYFPREMQLAPGGQLLHNIGAYGPSIWTPFIASIAGIWSANGYKDAARSLYSYIFQPTRVVRAGTAALANPASPVHIPGAETVVPPQGINIEAFNPSVGLGSKGSLAEEKQIPYYLYELLREGKLNDTEFQDAMHSKTGPLWDRAANMAMSSNAPSVLASTLFGTSGFKIKSNADLQIAKTWSDWYNISDQYDKLPYYQWRREVDSFDNSHPWFKAARMGRKMDPVDRDMDYYKMVLDRIPPGSEYTSATQATNVAPLIDKLYNSQIDPNNPRSNWSDGWNEMDLLTLKKAMNDLGNRYNVPPPEQGVEFDQARDVHRTLQALAIGTTQAMGYQVTADSMWNTQSGYFALVTPDGQPDPEARKTYLTTHPEITAYWQALDDAGKQAIPENTPTISATGDLGAPSDLGVAGARYTAPQVAASEEKFYAPQWKKDAQAQFGPDIFTLEDEYYALPAGTANKTSPERKAWQREHPDEYVRMAKEWDWEQTHKPADVPVQGGVSALPGVVTQTAQPKPSPLLAPAIAGAQVVKPATAPSNLMSVITSTFPQSEWNNALKIALRESGGRAAAINNTADPKQPGYSGPPGPKAMPELSVGLFQINILAHPEYTLQDMLDPVKNAAAAAKLQKEQQWRPWTTTTGEMVPAYEITSAIVDKAHAITYGGTVATATQQQNTAGQAQPVALTYPAGTNPVTKGTATTTGTTNLPVSTSGQLSSVEFAQRRADAANKWGKDILALADEYSALLKPDGTTDQATRTAWKRTHIDRMPDMEAYWAFINGAGDTPPGYNWQRNLTLPAVVDSYLDPVARDKLSAADQQHAQTWLIANVPGQYQQPGEWVQAKTAQDMFDYQAAKQFGDDIADLNSTYGASDTATRKAMKTTDPQSYARLIAYWDYRDQYGVDNPGWAKYYLASAAGGGTGTGYAYRGGGGGGGYSSSYSSSRYPTVKSVPVTPPGPSADQLLMARARVMTSDDYNTRVSAGRSSDPGFDPIVALTFGGGMSGMANSWFGMDATGRTAWMTANPAAYARLMAYLLWLLKYQTGAGARAMASIPVGSHIAPPPASIPPGALAPPPPAAPPPVA